MLVIDVHFLAPLSIFVGVTAFAFSRSKSAKGLSGTFLGLGLMLLSLQLLGRATEPLQHSKVLLALMDSLEEVPFLATTIAAMLAMATSSSMATVLLAMSLAASGAVSPELGIALTLGANLGGAIPPVMATTQDEAAARRVTIGNLFVRLIGCIVALPFLQTEAQLLSEFSTDVSSIVVNAHIVFNILLAVVFLPALQPVSAILRRLVPEALKLDEGPRHLDPNNLQVPALALTGAIRETLRMGDRVASMIEVNMEALRRSDPLGCSSIASMDDEVDRLNTAIKFYLAKLDRSNLMGREIERSDEIMGYATNLEHIGDIVDRNLNDLVEKKIRNQLSFSTDGAREIDGLYRLTLDNLRLAQSLLLSGDSGVARQLVEAKVDVRRLEQQSRANHVARLHEGVSESIQTSSSASGYTA
jgi:phosphate:Na+ symporter